MGKASRKKRTAQGIRHPGNKNLKSSGEFPEGGLRHKTFFPIVLIAVIGLIAYSNTFHVPFQFDDGENIVTNKIIKDLGYFAELLKAKGGAQYYAYKTRVIGYLTFALDYKIHGFDVTGYHVTNLSIHIINALLVYLLITLTFRTTLSNKSALNPNANLIALFSGLLFVSHPVQTQAVTYIVQRFASLATLFYLLSLVGYIKSRLSISNIGRFAFFAVSLVSAVIAMKTKEIAFTLPVIITLYEFMFFKGKIKTRFLYLVPVLLTMLIIPLSLLGTDKPIGYLINDVSEATRVKTSVSRLDYMFTEYRVIVTYIRLLFLPVNQNLDYDYPIYHSYFNAEVFLSFLFLSCILGLGVYLYHRSRSVMGTQSVEYRLISFGIFWFFVTLSVESSIIPITDVIFEHRVYLPSAGAFAAIATSLFTLRLKDKFESRQLHIDKVLSTAFLLMIIVLSSVTYARNAIWQNEIALWSDVIKKSPNKARGHTNLGGAYASEGRFDKAIAECQTSIRLEPDNASVHSNLAALYQVENQPDKAIAEYQTAFRLNPDFPGAHYNLAVSYLKKGDIDMAVSEYQAALRLNPDDVAAHNSLGTLYQSKGQMDMAVSEYQTALRLKPDFAKAHANLGSVYAYRGLVDMAIAEYQTALDLDPYLAEAHYNLAISYLKKGNIDMARREDELALRIRPDMDRARQLLKQIGSR